MYIGIGDVLKDIVLFVLAVNPFGNDVLFCTGVEATSESPEADVHPRFPLRILFVSLLRLRIGSFWRHILFERSIRGGNRLYEEV